MSTYGDRTCAGDKVITTKMMENVPTKNKDLPEQAKRDQVPPLPSFAGRCTPLSWFAELCPLPFFVASCASPSSLVFAHSPSLPFVRAVNPKS